jgi:ATP-dependent RNA helicase DeaD
MKVPQIKAVMKAVKRRIIQSVTAALPEIQEISETESLETAPVEVQQELASPILTQVSKELIESLGSERAVEALITLTYGDMLDPTRYGQITEFQETAPREEPRGRFTAKRLPFKEHPRRRAQAEVPSGSVRLYVGLGRQHGASVRDVVKLLSRAGGVPGHQVDAVEMKDYCAFATLPEEAAHRACLVSRKGSDPVIKPAAPPK